MTRNARRKYFLRCPPGAYRGVGIRPSSNCAAVRVRGMMGRMELYYHELDRQVLILSADGGLNADTASDFISQLETLIEFGVKKMIIDCTKLTYISSYGIGVLVRVHNKHAKKGGDVKIAAPPSRVLQALNLARLGQLFEIYPDVNQARLAFREPDK
jgi:anti-sigma B factor antagonist